MHISHEVKKKKKEYLRMYTINECEMHKIEFNYLLSYNISKEVQKNFIYKGNNSKLFIHKISIYL